MSEAKFRRIMGLLSPRRGNMQEKCRFWRKVAPVCLTVVTWSGCIAIFSLLLDLAIEKLFRGDREALLSWLMLQDKRLFLILLISWLIIGSGVVIMKFLCRLKAAQKSVEESLQPRGILK